MLPEIIKNEEINHRNIQFRNVLFELKEKDITKEDYAHIERIYKNTKHAEIRNKCLKLLFNKSFPGLKDFFTLAYKKERYLDMKILAVRGLSQFLTETEVDDLMVKFINTLIKRPEKTPYNYQEYELLKGKHALPYLINKYQYSSFKKALEITNNNYNKMPDAFKGHFTTDVDGEIILLRSSDEAGKMMDKFFQEQRKKLS